MFVLLAFDMDVGSDSVTLDASFFSLQPLTNVFLELLTLIVARAEGLESMLPDVV